MKEYYKEYVENDGIYPANENKKWETKEQLRTRVMSVINKYKDNYDKVIVVAHKMAFQSISDCGDMKPQKFLKQNFKFEIAS